MPEPRRTRVEKGIHKRPDGKFEIGWRDSQGRQRWRTVDGGIRVARAELAKAHSARARGERVAGDPRLTFDTAADAWLDTRVVKLAPATQVSYRASLKHLRPELGRSRLTDITATDVSRYIDLKRTTGLKGWTLKGHVNVISAVFEYAARHMGFTGQNPVKLLDKIERPNTDDERPKRILSAEEMDRLLGATTDQYRLLFTFTARTGARLGETLGLTWGNVDLDAGTVTIEQQLDKKTKTLKKLKSRKSRRTIEIDPPLVAGLRQHKLKAPRSGKHELVFLNRAGNPHDHRNVAGRALAATVTRAGLEAVMVGDQVAERAPTFHSLRHSHGSALIAYGWDIQEVSSRLGHADVSVTARIYVHEFDRARRTQQRSEKLAAMYGEMPTASVTAEVARIG